MRNRVLGGIWELYKSFSALNFTLLAALVAFLGARGLLTPERLRAVVDVFRPAPEAPEEAAPPPDLAAWKNFATNEERESFLQSAYDLLQQDRARVRRELEVLERRHGAEKATLEALKAAVERDRAALDAKEKSFDARKTTWETNVDEESFAAQVKVYEKMKEDVLAELLVNGRGEEGDLYMVRVLRAISASDPRRAAKLETALLAHEMCGPGRFQRIKDLWLAAEVPAREEEPSARAEAPEENPVR